MRAYTDTYAIKLFQNVYAVGLAYITPIVGASGMAATKVVYWIRHAHSEHNQRQEGAERALREQFPGFESPLPAAGLEVLYEVQGFRRYQSG